MVPQGSLNRILQSAEEAWNKRDFKRAIEQLERASRLAPANCQILLQLGRVYGLRYDYASAERCFEKAIRVAPRKTEMLSAAAGRAVDFANHELAERYFQQAAAQSDMSADALSRMAELYERLHRNGEASALLERALGLQPAFGPALLIRARLDRQTGKLEDAERGLQTLLRTENRELRARAYYELGMVLDRQGQYDKAMSAWKDAKSLLQPDAASLLAQLEVVRGFWGEMQKAISREVFQRWLGAAELLQPTRRLAYLGGYARSGTTLLEQVLDSHPDVASAEETPLFNDEVYSPLANRRPPGTPMLDVLDSAPPVILKEIRANYLQKMEQHVGKPMESRLLIDKNPAINVLIPAFVRAFPEIKLLIALRDPRDVCLSCFMQAHLPLNKANVAFLTLEGTVEGYTRVMGLWRTLAPMLEGHFLEVRYEDMVEDLESVARRTLNFLGVEWNDKVLAFDEHARSKRVRSPTYADVAKPVSKRAVGRWRNYQKYLEPYLEKLEPYVKEFGYET